jgi:thiol-disulfide isomerase/thioredoxin
VVSNFGHGAADWPKKTQKAFEEYVGGGGGFVVVHAADNSFPKWKEYNKMFGFGGWGGRTAKDGPYVYYSNDGKLVRDPSPGRSGSHGPAHNIPITIRVSDHSITKGMPKNWLTAKDECYALLRGPAENMTVLATGKDVSGKAPRDVHEPMLMVIDYGKGRVFHTALGHDDYSFEGVGFIVALTRGTEWAATGKVTQDIPKDFPTAEKSISRKFELKEKIAPKKPAPKAGLILPDDASTAASTLFISEWLKGEPVDVTDGKNIYVVEFWATWCPPCLKSMPHITELQKKYKDSVTFIAVTSKSKEAQRGVTIEQVKKFVADHDSDMGYTIAVDDDFKSNKAYQGRYDFKWIPHAYIVSRKGNVIWHGNPMRLDGVLKQIVK